MSPNLLSLIKCFSIRANSTIETQSSTQDSKRQHLLWREIFLNIISNRLIVSFIISPLNICVFLHNANQVTMPYAMMYNAEIYI